MANSSKKRIFVCDDDQLSVKVMGSLLENAGYHVDSTTKSNLAVDLIRETKPDCIVCDLMMPDIDGLNLCKQIRGSDDLKHITFIMVSAKAYEFDEKRSYEFGANGYIRKPINTETFAANVSRILDDQVDMTFWGVRGTLPVSGENALKYGGNTSCVTLEFPRGQFFIFDGGSGIKKVGDWLMTQRRKRLNAKMFISHPHWDHINAIPFFAPLYGQGNEIEILGANQGDITMQELISAQMDGVYFPITLSEFSARIYFRDLEEEIIRVDGIEVETKLLSHPGKCLGYRVNYNGRSVCYITDNEMYLEGSEYFDPHYEQTLADFCRDTDILITDTTYSDAEYETKVGWGHSCVGKVANLAHNASAKTLYLFHHDPDQNDTDIDAKLAAATSALAKLDSSTVVVAPCEGDRFRI